MAAQAGIWYFDARPVKDDTLLVLESHNSTLGPDGRTVYRGDGLVLMSFAQHFDALSQRERQPFLSPDGSVLTWDGRLDSRADIAARVQQDLRGDYSDAALVSNALGRWGPNCLQDIIGDWSLVLWNSRARQLTLARDYIGNRSLYYSWSPDCFVWSTALHPIAALRGLRGRVNEHYFAGWLAFDTPPHETCYEGVLSVPPGHALQVRLGESPVPRAVIKLRDVNIRYRHVHDYEDHFRDLITKAISVRLRAKRTVWTELSGGYDSSTVTCIASSLVRSGAVEAPGIQPISDMRPDSPESDEGVYVTSVEHQCDITSVRGAYRRYLDLDPRAYGIQPLTNCEYVPSTQCVADRSGSHVLMTGMFGDVITGWPSTEAALLDCLRSGHIGAFARGVLTSCRLRRLPLYELMRALRRVHGADRRRMISSRHFSADAMADVRRLAANDIATVFGLRREFVHRAFTPTSPVPINVAGRSAASRAILNALALYTLNYSHSGREWFPLRITHPFMDRPLVEFMLGLPLEGIWSPLHPRAFALAALRDVLPHSVLHRGHKGDARPAYVRDVSPLVAHVAAEVDSWLLVKSGYADGALLKEIVTRFIDGSQQNHILVSRLLSAEVLLQRIHSNTHAVMETAATR